MYISYMQVKQFAAQSSPFLTLLYSPQMADGPAQKNE